MLKARTQGVYGITLLLEGRVYIGSSVWIEKRLRVHLNKLRSGTHENPHLQSAFNFYGEDQFLFATEEVVPDLLWLRAREQMWLSRTKACDPKFGFNSATDAFSNFCSPAFLNRYKDHPEEREKQSRRQKEVQNRPEVRKRRVATLRQTLSDPAQRVRLSQNTKNLWMNPEHKDKVFSLQARANMSAAQNARFKHGHNCVGRKYSQATLEKMRSSALARHKHERGASHV